MREDDWKIHEYMGNDLTGWEWDKENWIVLRTPLGEKATKIQYFEIPLYSTTWEGAGLVMESLKVQQYRVRSQCTHNDSSVWIETYEFDGSFSPRLKCVGLEVEQNFPLALAKAYISAMEERENG